MKIVVFGKNNIMYIAEAVASEGRNENLISTIEIMKG